MCDGGEGGPQPSELPVPGLEVAELRVQEHQLGRGLVWGHGLTQQITFIAGVDKASFRGRNLQSKADIYMRAKTSFRY